MLIYDILDSIREKPALFMGSKSLTVLRNFLEGALYTSQILGMEDGDQEFAPVPFRFFNDYVAQSYNYYESTSGWKNMILDKHRGEEKTSFDAFYTLLDNFRSIEIIKIQKSDLTQDQINHYMENEYAPKSIILSDCNGTKPLFTNPKAIYLVELFNDLGYLCMIEDGDTIFLYSSLLRSRQSAIKYLNCFFDGSYQWYIVESIPEKFEWI